MRVARIDLHQIGPFENASFEIPPPAEDGAGELVIFEGPNGSGKTTIAHALIMAALAEFPTARLSDEEFERLSERFHRDLAQVNRRPPICNWKQRFRSRSARGAVTISRQGAELSVPVGPANLMITLGEVANNPGRETILRTLLQYQAARLKEEQRVQWAAFALQGHQRTPRLRVQGPAAMDEPPLLGAPAFGGEPPPLGQFLTNLEFERVRRIANREPGSADVSPAESALARIQRALSMMLGRKVEIAFEPGAFSPTVLFDGAEIPLKLLGEGMRSTLAWLSELVIRLERTTWADPSRSPFDQPFWLILDEVDESLHPQMQMRLLPALRGLFPRAHIFITTHSPFVVASVGDGYVFSIRPEIEHHLVMGRQTARRLEPGQSLEWVVSEIFSTPSTFIDPETRNRLRDHDRCLVQLRAGRPIDWAQFLRDRGWLMTLNDEVRAVVAMREVPVRRVIEARIKGEEA